MLHLILLPAGAWKNFGKALMDSALHTQVRDLEMQRYLTADNNKQKRHADRDHPLAAASAVDGKQCECRQRIARSATDGYLFRSCALYNPTARKTTFTDSGGQAKHSLVGCGGPHVYRAGVIDVFQSSKPSWHCLELTLLSRNNG
jgi:hypothetical protein